MCLGMIRPILFVLLLALFVPACGKGDAARTELLRPGTAAPAFSAMDQAGQWRTLDEYRGKWVVLYFYPKDETPGCTKEACAFRDAYQNYEREGVTILGVSTDTAQSHAAFAKAHNLPFPLLADPDSKVLALFGVSSTMGLAHRVSFLIAPDGKVARTFDSVDPVVHASEVLGEVRKLKQQGSR